MTTTNRPRVAAVVLNYCREALTVACVESLEAQRPSVEIVIVDNASPDGSGARLQGRFPDHAFVQTGGNFGYSGGNNRGMERALALGAEYLFVINEDAEVDSGCVESLVAALDADAGAGVAVPTVVHADADALVWWADGYMDVMRGLALHRYFGWKVAALPAPLRPGAPPRAVPVISGCALLIRADVLRRLGGFREDYVNYLEDTELSYRWSRAGQRLVHVPGARVRHKVAYPPPPPTPYQIRMRDRNRLKFAREVFDLRERLLFHSWFWPTRFAIAVRYLLTGDGKRLTALVQGCFVS